MRATSTILRLFLSRLFTDKKAWVLPVAAFGTVTTLGLLVAGGTSFFWDMTSELAIMYQILSVLAVGLLIIPMSSLAGSAARLLARRRDERLSSLRLLGASSGTLRSLAVAEATVLALIGAIVGIVGYLVLMPIVGLLRFAGGTIGASGMWLGIPGVLGVTASIVVIGAVSSFAGLRRIEITPLGVRTRQSTTRVHWARIITAVIILIIAQIASQGYGATGLMMMVIMLVIALSIPLVALSFIGPWLVKKVTEYKLRRANTAEKLVAARTILESPQQAWRQIGGVAVTTYIGVVGGTGTALMGSASAESTNPDDAMIATDISTGVLLTMVIAFLLTACSVGITQAATVLDRAQLYRGLNKIGMTTNSMESVRRKTVFGPLWIVLAFTLACAAISIMPILGSTMLTEPLSMLVITLCLIAGVLLIAGGVRASHPALKRVITTA